MTSLQDLYPDDFAHCYGCGRLNTQGLHVRSEWKDGDMAAAAASMVAAGDVPRRDATPRFVTASLHVDFIRPTPLGPELVLRSRAVEIGERKVIVDMDVLADDVACARARVIAVRAPATMRALGGAAASQTAPGARRRRQRLPPLS